ALPLRGDAPRRRDCLRDGLPPGMCRQRVTGRPPLGIDQRGQLLAAIEAHRPAPLSPHLLRLHLAFLLGDARPQVSALATSEGLAALGRQTTAWIFFAAGSKTSALLSGLARGGLPRLLR